MQSIFIPSGLFPTKPRSGQVVLFFEKDTPILHFCNIVCSVSFVSLHRTFLLLQSFWIVHIMQTRKMAFSSSSSSMVRDDEEKPHVLAVDDSLVDRKIIERLLTSSSYKVTTAENGQKALELLGLVEGQYSKSTRESTINLIITDYCMPGMTGYDLLKRVKGSSNLKEIPVVIVSSENVPTRIKKCLEEGAQEFMLKPLKQSDVKKLGCHMTKVTESCSGRLWIGR